MFFEMFLRIFSDCCIFFGLLGCAPSLLPHSYPLPAVAVVCGLSAALASFLHDKNRRILSILCAALPFLSLLMTDGWREMLVLILPIVYTCAIIVRGELYLEYYHYRRFFLRSVSLLAFLWCALSVCIYIEDPQHLSEQLIFPSILLKYTLIHFLCGVILQRQLRMGEHGQGSAGQMFGMLSAAGVTALGFVTTQSLLQEKLVEFLRGVIAVGIILLTPLYELVTFMRLWLKEHGPKPEFDPNEVTGNSEGAAGAPTGGGKTAYQEYLEGAPAGTDSTRPMVIAIVGAVVFLVLMFFVFAALRSKKGSGMIVSTVRGKEKNRKNVSRLSNRGKVRQMYREFLHFEKQKGFVRKKHYTTADILRKVSTSETEDAAHALRGVYLHARYNEEGEVTRAQVDTAREALRAIRKT